MLLQDTFGEFDSTQRLRNLIQLICQLTGTYEVLLKAESGEEGIIHCSTGTVRNAACRNLSGIDALAVILTWSKGKYWLEELPVLPVRTINEPLDKIFAEVENLAKQKTATPFTKETVFETAPALPPQSSPLKQQAVENKTPASQPEVKTEKMEIKEAPLPKLKEELPPETGSRVSPVVRNEGEPAAPVESKSREGIGLAQKIAAIDGAEGIIIASIDGTLLKVQDVDSGPQMAQLLALLGEALEQVAEAFEKGKLIHGSIEFTDHRILVHPFKNKYIGTKISFDSSSAMIGSEIEKLLSEEPSDA